MLHRLANTLGKILRGIALAVRARPTLFVAVAGAVLVLSVFLPPVVLSLIRKPWDYFAFNAWLSKLPEYLASTDIPLKRKLEFLPNLALFWFSANGPYGSVEWGFAVDVSDLVRFIFTSLVVATYFALVFYRRDQLAQCGWRATASRSGGAAGALASVLGLSTGPCSVVGCGAPVLPVVGLAFAGLSSGTLKFLSETSRVATLVVLGALTLGVAYLAWRAGNAPGGNSVPST